jgi:hypothetical protein
VGGKEKSRSSQKDISPAIGPLAFSAENVNIMAVSQAWLGGRLRLKQLEIK